MGSGEQDGPQEWGEGPSCVGGGSAGFGLGVGAGCGFVTPQHPAGHAQPHSNASPSCCPAWLSPCSVSRPHILHLCHGRCSILTEELSSGTETPNEGRLH